MISSCRADPVAATGQFSCPPAGRHLAVSGQSLVTVVKRMGMISLRAVCRPGSLVYACQAITSETFSCWEPLAVMAQCR